jgi:hypothetical protein
MDELLSIKELALALKRSESYIFAMRRRGFRMVAGRTTLKAALLFLSRVPRPFVGESKRTEVRRSSQ